MFGISFTELVLILVVALVVLGPQRLPGMLRTVGLWIHKLRTLSTEVRAQTGIDELLRQEGIAGGLAEVRALLRGDPRFLTQPLELPIDPALRDPYPPTPPVDESRERPVEGPDAYGALADDLVVDELFAPGTSILPSSIGEPPPSESSGKDATLDSGPRAAAAEPADCGDEKPSNGAGRADS